MRMRLAVGLGLFVGAFIGGCDCPCKHRATTTPTTQASLAAPAPAPVSMAAPAPAAKAAPSVAGPWTWNVDAGGMPITHSVVFKLDGEKLTGKFTDSYDNTTVDIQDGKIQNGHVTFTVTRPFMDNGTLTLKFDGQFDGTAITGKMDITIADQTTTSDWNAKRGA